MKRILDLLVIFILTNAWAYSYAFDCDSTNLVSDLVEGKSINKSMVSIYETSLFSGDDRHYNDKIIHSSQLEGRYWIYKEFVTKHLSIGFDKSLMMLLCLKNNTRFKEFVISNNWLSFDHYEVYTLMEDGSLHSLRTNLTNTLSTEVNIDSESAAKLVIFASSSDLMLFSLMFHLEDEFQTSTSKHIHVSLLFFGAMITLCIYNLFFGVMGFGSYYYMYSITQFCYFIYAFCISGLVFYIYQDTIPYYKDVWVISAFLCNFTSLLFFSSLVDLRRRSQVGHTVIVFIASTWVMCFLSYYYMDRMQVFLGSTLLAGLSAVTLIIISISVLKQSYLAMIYLVGWSPLLISNLLNIAALYGFIPRSEFVVSTLYIGMAIESLVLGFAIAKQVEWTNKLRNLKSFEEDCESIDEYVSHEFRTPLTIVSNNLELIENDGKVNGYSLLKNTSILCSTLNLIFWLKGNSVRDYAYEARLEKVICDTYLNFGGKEDRVFSDSNQGFTSESFIRIPYEAAVYIADRMFSEIEIDTIESIIAKEKSIRIKFRDSSGFQGCYGNVRSDQLYNDLISKCGVAISFDYEFAFMRRKTLVLSELVGHV